MLRRVLRVAIRVHTRFSGVARAYTARHNAGAFDAYACHSTQQRQCRHKPPRRHAAPARPLADEFTARLRWQPRAMATMFCCRRVAIRRKPRAAGCRCRKMRDVRVATHDVAVEVTTPPPPRRRYARCCRTSCCACVGVASTALCRRQHGFACASSGAAGRCPEAYDVRRLL